MSTKPPPPELETIKHEGLHVQRLAPGAGNPRETAFAKCWLEENSGWHSPHVLSTLLTRTEGGDPFNPFSGKTIQLAPFDQHAASVAATVIQWLGSNVGLSFLERALGNCGLEIKGK